LAINRNFALSLQPGLNDLEYEEKEAIIVSLLFGGGIGYAGIEYGLWAREF
jgi:hypothetical protein